MENVSAQNSNEPFVWLTKVEELTYLVPKMFMEDNPAVPLGILFHDEVHFHLNAQTTRERASEQLHSTVESLLHQDQDVLGRTNYLLSRDMRWATWKMIPPKILL